MTEQEKDEWIARARQFSRSVNQEFAKVTARMLPRERDQFNAYVDTRISAASFCRRYAKYRSQER